MSFFDALIGDPTTLQKLMGGGQQYNGNAMGALALPGNGGFNMQPPTSLANIGGGLPIGVKLGQPSILGALPSLAPFAAPEPSQIEVAKFAQQNNVGFTHAYMLLKQIAQQMMHAMYSGVPLTPTAPVQWMGALAQAPGGTVNPQSQATPQMMGFPITAVPAGTSVQVTARATKAFLARKFSPNLTFAAATTNIGHVYFTSFLISGETQLNGSDPVPATSYNRLDEWDNFTGRAVTPQAPVQVTVLNTGGDAVTFGGSLRGPTLDA